MMTSWRKRKLKTSEGTESKKGTQDQLVYCARVSRATENAVSATGEQVAVSQLIHDNTQTLP